MAEQVVHHKRIFDRYISREYDHPFQSNTPGFRELTTLKFGQDIVLSLPRQVQDRQSSQAAVPLTAIYDAFSYYRVRYIILKLPTNPKQANSVSLDDYRAAIKQIVSGGPIYTDSQIEVYAVPQSIIGNQQPFFEISGTNWYDPEPNGAEPDHFHRWSSGPAGFNLVWEGPANRAGELSLTLGTLQDGSPAEIRLDGKVVWSGELNNAPQKINLPLLLVPGKHEILLDVEGKAKRPLSLGIGDDTRALLFLSRGCFFSIGRICWPD